MSATKSLTFACLLGSLRAQSLNAVVAQKLASLAPENVEISALGSIGDLPHYNADLQAAGFPAAVLDMGKQISEADALIIVTPEYNYSVPGALKNALDWLSRLPDTPIAGKPVAIQTVSPGAIGGARAQYHLRQIMVFLDGRVLNKPEVMVGQALNKIDVAEREIVDKQTCEIITRQLTALAKMVN